MKTAAQKLAAAKIAAKNMIATADAAYDASIERGYPLTDAGAGLPEGRISSVSQRLTKATALLL